MARESRRQWSVRRLQLPSWRTCLICEQPATHVFDGLIAETARHKATEYRTYRCQRHAESMAARHALSLDTEKAVG